MTFEQFVQTKQYHYDLGPVIRDECLDGIGGMCYLDCLHIEDTHTWAEENGFTRQTNRWFLLIDRAEYDSDDLELLEKILFSWAVDEGYNIE